MIILHKQKAPALPVSVTRVISLWPGSNPRSTLNAKLLEFAPTSAHIGCFPHCKSKDPCNWRRTIISLITAATYKLRSKILKDTNLLVLEKDQIALMISKYLCGGKKVITIETPALLWSISCNLKYGVWMLMLYLGRWDHRWQPCCPETMEALKTEIKSNRSYSEADQSHKLLDRVWGNIIIESE